MFFAIEFFLTIASYQFSKNDWIFMNHGLFFCEKYSQYNQLVEFEIFVTAYMKDLGSNPSAVESVIFSTEKFSNSLNILNTMLLFSILKIKSLKIVIFLMFLLKKFFSQFHYSKLYKIGNNTVVENIFPKKSHDLWKFNHFQKIGKKLQ